MLNLEYAEFYITNVCNLNCDRCNRFNNYAFSGHLDWQAHADLYAAWSRILTVDRIGILGGEPMLHPAFEQWITEIAALWPHSQIMIFSNGTQLQRFPGLYDLLARYQGRIRIDINRHNAAAKASTLQQIESWYPHGFDKFVLNSEKIFAQTGVHGVHEQHHDAMINTAIDAATTGGEIWADKSYEVVYRDQSLVTVRYATADSFDESVIRLDSMQHSLYLTPELSDPDQAVSVCGCKYSHHFFQGKLYKCGVTAVLPEFLSQFVVDIPQAKQALISAYEPAAVTWPADRLQRFLQHLSDGHSIPQCGLCCTTPVSQNFAAGHKKLKFQKQVHV